jgi:hypothetical protein
LRDGPANLIQSARVLLREWSGRNAAARSGGVYPNQRFAAAHARMPRELRFYRPAGFTLPGRDGGISRGRAAVAAVRDLVTCSD